MIKPERLEQGNWKIKIFRQPPRTEEQHYSDERYSQSFHRFSRLILFGRIRGFDNSLLVEKIEMWLIVWPDLHPSPRSSFRVVQLNLSRSIIATNEDPLRS